MRTSLIIPAYNSREYIEGTVEAAARYLARLEGESELIVVDDGSADRSLAVLRNLADSFPMVRVISEPANRGKGYAVRRGMISARGERAVFTDADLAYPVEEVGKALAALDDGADVVVANRVSPRSRYIMSPEFFSYLYTRHLGSRFFNLLVRVTLGLQTRDCQAGLKGFSRRARELIFPRLTLDGFAFDVEALFVARKLGLSVREIPVQFHYSSEPSTVAFAADAMRALRDLARVRINDLRGVYESVDRQR